MAEHWKSRLRETCRVITADMHRRFQFIHKVTGSNVNAYASIDSAGRYVIRSMFPVGYVTLGVYLHEVGHVAHDDCGLGQTKTSLYQECRAWGFAKSIMAEHGLEWVDSVSNLARTCLTSHLKATGEKVEPGSVPAAIIAALTRLDKQGI